MAAPAVAQTADDQCKPLPVLAAPTVTVNGKTDGNQNFSYVVVAHFPNGSAAASPPGSVKNGSDVSAADFNTVSWAAVPGADRYEVYRTVGPNGVKKGHIYGTDAIVSGNQVTHVDDKAGTPPKLRDGDDSTPSGITLLLDTRCILSSSDTRIVVGGEDGAPSAMPTSLNAVLDVMLMAPIARRLGGWLDLRLSSAPAASSTVTIGQLSSALGSTTSLSTSLQGERFDKVLAGFTMKMGFDVPILARQRLRMDTQYSIEPDAIFGFGLKTPLNAQVDAPQTYYYNTASQPFKDAYPQLDDPIRNKKYDVIAFVPQDRSRFYSEWFAGLRLKTHHYHESDNAAHTDAYGNRKKIDAAFPGIIDITFGQNQAITAGLWNGTVAHVGAFYPLPLEGAAAAFYVFGSVDVHMTSAVPSPSPSPNGTANTLSVGKTNTSTAVFYLQPAQTSDGKPLPLFDEKGQPTVQIQPINPADRDEWRFGVGVDLGTLLRVGHLRGKQ
ncbi:MAG: hypothetical protein LAO77_15300 [Acidobacteriia bacterium]|nr:hypothetical protein [Terriglobia bacterium]